MQNLINSLNQNKQIEDRRAVYVEAKNKVQQIVDGFKKLEKHCKKTKESRKFMKLANDFLHCNITSDAIEKKYLQVVGFLSVFYNARNENVVED